MLELINKINSQYGLYKCECGNESIRNNYSVKYGLTTSCGCIRKKLAKESATKHGLSYLPEYKIWKGIRKRCNNKNFKFYQYYGGRGIKVCERWNDFINFYNDMGNRPSENHWIER